jgi:predicted ester cyclase
VKLWQQSMIRLARSQRVTVLVQGQRRLESLSRRFVSGTSASHAVECAAQLRRIGIAASMFFLAEYVTDQSVIAVTVRQLTEVIELAAAGDLDVCASVDPTQIGLMIDEDTATRNARVLAEAAARAAGQRPRRGHDALMIDMEDATIQDVACLDGPVRCGSATLAGTRCWTGMVSMSTDDNKRVVAEFVRRCQDQHDLAFADEIFHPRFENHYRPEGRAIPSTKRPASGFQAFYGALLRGFPDATMEINDQIAERDLVTTRKTLRGTHLGELWDLAPTGNRVEFEFIDIFRVAEGKLVEHWTSMDLGALKSQMLTWT